MAFGWLTLLKSVPWAGVISTAPLVADGAKQLWKAVSKKPLPEPVPASPRPAHTSGSPAIEALESRIATLETRVDDLHAQLLKSSELIKVLADQNALLIQRAESNRVRTLWLTAIILIVAIAGVVNLVVTWLR